MTDRRVEAAIARFRLLPRDELYRVAAGPYEAQAVLLLAEPPLTVEARYLASVAHLPGQGAFLALQSVAKERGREADVRLRDEPCGGLGCAGVGYQGFHRRFAPGCAIEPCSRLCVLVNQGPCRCVVPRAVAELRRRQRALLWAAEAIMRPPVEEASFKATLRRFARLCQIEALSKPSDDADDWTHRDRVHLRETAAMVKERLMSIGPK